MILFLSPSELILHEFKGCRIQLNDQIVLTNANLRMSPTEVIIVPEDVDLGREVFNFCDVGFHAIAKANEYCDSIHLLLMVSKEQVDDDGDELSMEVRIVPPEGEGEQTLREMYDLFTKYAEQSSDSEADDSEAVVGNGFFAADSASEDEDAEEGDGAVTKYHRNE